MARMKTFFIYFLLVILFFIFSQIMIYFGIKTTYQYKNVEIKTTIPIEATVKATSVNGIANIKIKNNDGANLENKYLEIACYSKHDVEMGTKYIEIGKINKAEEKEFEIRFNYNKVERATIDIVDKKELEEKNIPEEDRVSDKEMGLAAMISALILMIFFVP